MICDPYYYVCGAIRLSRFWDRAAAGTSASTSVAGVGLPSETRRIYVETRYHYIWGPEIAQVGTLPTSVSSANTKVNGQYWPLTFGSDSKANGESALGGECCRDRPRLTAACRICIAGRGGAPML